MTAAQQDCEATLFQLVDHVEQDCRAAQENHEQFSERCDNSQQELESVAEAARTFWQRRGLELADVRSSVGNNKEWSSTLLRRSSESRERAESLLAQLRQLKTTRFLDEGWWLPLLVAVLLGGAWPLGRLVRFQPILWWPLVAAITLGVTLLARAVASFLLVRVLRDCGSDSRAGPGRLGHRPAAGPCRLASRNGRRAGPIGTS